MRSTFILVLVALVSICYGQGTLHVTLNFTDKNGSALSNAKVVLKETSNSGKVELTTNTTGAVTTTLTAGKEWAIFVNGFQMRKTIEMPEFGEGTVTMKETYDPETAKRFAAQVYTRDGFTVTESRYVKGQRPPAGYLADAIYVVNKSNMAQADVEVCLVNVTDKTVFTSRTDNKGKAYFWLEKNKKYDVDIEGRLNVSWADMPDEEGWELTETVKYQKPLFTEERKNDTIHQNLNGVSEPATGYQYFKLEVIKEGGASGEDVYLWDVKGTEVYHGTTNEEGILEMMLPIRKKYMIDFNYQKDVDVVDLTMSYGGGSSTRSMRVTYIPDPKLEHPELYIPLPDQLMLKDFTAFAHKQYTKSRKVAIHARFQNKINAQSKEAVLEIGLNTNFQPKAAKLNLAFVMDRSGSMAGYERIELLKESLIAMIPRLPADATISILTYDDVMTVLVPPQKIGTSQQNITALINDIQPGGGTSMLETMNQGYGFVQQAFDPKAVNKVILMSDGWDVNEVQVLVDAQKKFPNIECSTIGIGKDFNYPLLKILAENGKGKLFYVESKESYDSVFTNQLITQLMPVAVDVQLDVIYNDRIVFKHLYGFTPIRSDANPVTFKIPNLYSASTEFSLAKFDLVRPDSTLEKEPVIIRVSYTNPETGVRETTEEKVYLEWSSYNGELELLADAENKKLYCLAVLNQSIKTMSDKFAAGNVEEAKQIIERAKEQVKAIYKTANDPDVNALMDSLEEYLKAFKNLAKKKK